MSLDPRIMELLPSTVEDDDPIFATYLDYVANDALLQYQTIFQYGKKQGESLYTHVMNGIGVLQSLRPALQLTDIETYVLFTAYTIHDINKVLKDNKRAFNALATPENYAEEIQHLGLEDFFPEWQTYLQDITNLGRRHSGHSWTGGESLVRKHKDRYGLPLARLDALVHLMRAIDRLDLAKSLYDRTHQEPFLLDLNTYLADSSIGQAYEFHTHQLVEQRGLLTSVIHNAVMEVLTDDPQVIPLLLYPDGVAYLTPRGYLLSTVDDLLPWLAESVAQHINALMSNNAGNLIEQTAQGIKVKPDALELAVSFKSIWAEINKLAAKRSFKVGDFNEKAVEKLLSQLQKIPPEQHSELETHLLEQAQKRALFVNASDSQLLSAELARTFFLLLKTYFEVNTEEAWQHIYELLELPPDNYEFYRYFDPTYLRPYVLAGDIQLDTETVSDRLLNDGKQMWENRVPSTSTPRQK